MKLEDTKWLNIRHTYKGLLCDILIDFPRAAHGYVRGEIKDFQVPIEVCCIDKDRWGMETKIVDLDTTEDYGRFIPADQCIKFCEEWVDRKLEEDKNLFTVGKLIKRLSTLPLDAIVTLDHEPLAAIEHIEEDNEINLRTYE